MFPDNLVPPVSDGVPELTLRASHTHLLLLHYRNVVEVKRRQTWYNPPASLIRAEAQRATFVVRSRGECGDVCKDAGFVVNGAVALSSRLLMVSSGANWEPGCANGQSPPTDPFCCVRKHRRLLATIDCQSIRQ